MKLKIYSAIIALGALALLPACSGDDNEDPKVAPRHAIALSEQEKNDVAEVNEFGYRLWNNIQTIDDSRNDFYSPLGVHFVLSMLANGAEGETLQQITDLLGSDDLDALNQLDKKLLKELPMVDRNVRMSIANSCWLDKNFSVLSSYSDALKDVFGSEVMRYSMGTDEAREAVNKWCASKTNGMIPDFLSENPNYDIHAAQRTLLPGEMERTV